MKEKEKDVPGPEARQPPGSHGKAVKVKYTEGKKGKSPKAKCS